ncbi:CLUMA_CG017311, isoform A [Clunio marinus]|uniref:CLUMA_CG017311, isoform A n=1 Tax=Clunio marinus TaxID=568069 RepID=A0A1J1IXC0_9DIPT|nr:CLUMA_CG017311, isoform A [Clunio marinus]
MFLSRSIKSKISRLWSINFNRLILKQQFHVSAVTCDKKFINNEIIFNSKFIQKYEQIVPELNVKEFELETSYENKSADEIVEAFENLSHYCCENSMCINNESYNELIYKLVGILKELPQNQLAKILSDLSRFPQTQSPFSNNFHKLWKALDNICCDRIKDWDQQTLLKFCNLWLQLHLSQVGQFTWKALKKICRRVDRLSAKDLVEAMFYVSVCRKSVKLHDVEIRMYKIFDEFTIQELGVLCLAFFKTETKMKVNVLMDKIIDATIKEIDNIEDITLVSLLKNIRYCSDPTHALRIEKLCDALIPKIDKVGLITCLHAVLLGGNLQYCNHQLIEKVLIRFNNQIKELRLKEIDRITFLLGLFDFKASSGIEKEFLVKVVEEIKTRIDEILKYPTILPTTTHYLTICGISDDELIKQSLNPEFIKLAYGSSGPKIGREVLCLDSYTQINSKNYDGPRLSSKSRGEIVKYLRHYVPTRYQVDPLTSTDKHLLDLKEFMEMKHGTNLLTHVLPHFQRPDVVYCFDENGKSVTDKIIDGFKPLNCGWIFSKNHVFSNLGSEFSDNIDKYQMVAIVIGGWNFYIRGTRKPTGGLQMKIEQLQLVGYNTILIHWNEWRMLNDETREQFIDCHLRSVLNSHKRQSERKLG